MEKSIADLAEITPIECSARVINGGENMHTNAAGCSAPAAAPEEINAEETSRQAMLALAIRDQRVEIVRHLRAMVLRLGQIVTLDEAARDWIPNHAAAWRARHEAQLQNSDVEVLSACGDG